MSSSADAFMGIFGFKRVDGGMKTIEETRRGMFEAWFENRSGRKPRLQKSGRYSDIVPALAWQGFNAALDAVVIELPAMHVAGEMSGACVLASCQQAIESTNLGLKTR